MSLENSSSFATFRQNVLKGAKELREKYPEYRKGQSVFNYAEEKYGEVARVVQLDRCIDCFYDDSKIEPFVSAVYRQRLIELIEKLDNEDMFYLVSGSLISADNLGSVITRKETVEGFLEVLSECKILPDNIKKYRESLEKCLDILKSESGEA